MDGARDYHGNLRIVDGTVDIGASEYGFGVGKLTIGADLTISWESVTGRSYKVQWASSLDSPDRQDVGTEMLGDGGALSLQDPLAAVTQRFYRVIAP